MGSQTSTRSLMCCCVLSLAIAVAEADGCCKQVALVISPVQQATQADVVVIGKVTELDPDLAMVEPHPGGGPVGHMVATVRIEESLLGAKGLTHLRIGYVPSLRAFAEDENLENLGRSGRSWRGAMNLVPGHEACFFLQKHPTADFYVMIPYAYPLTKTDLQYETDLKAVRKLLSAFEKPIEALQAKDAGERQLAACALVLRYRTARNHGAAITVANEPIPAAESKLLLHVLGEMKWGELPFDPNGAFSLQNVFQQMNLTPNDGWQPPQPKENEDYNVQMNQAVSKWVKEHSDRYRVQRLIARPQVRQ